MTVHPLLYEAGLIPASKLLNYRQRQYAYRLLSLPDQHLAKNILPISLKKGDASYQPGELPENTLMWTENARPTLYGHWLAWQISIGHSIDPADGVEPVEDMEVHRFTGEIVIQPKKEAFEEAKISNRSRNVDRWIKARSWSSRAGRLLERKIP